MSSISGRPPPPVGPNTVPERLVLVVDDEEDLRTMLVANLNARAVPAIGVASVDAARVALLHRTIDVLVTDYSMPLEDGVSLIRWVRDQPRLRGLAVVLVTAREDDSIRRLVVELGGVFVAKPFDTVGLMKAIERAKESALDGAA